jgi:hypothetical protein
MRFYDILIFSRNLMKMGPLVTKGRMETVVSISLLQRLQGFGGASLSTVPGGYSGID